MRFSVPNNCLVISTLVLASMSNVQAEGITRGAMLSHSCAACHGTDGRSPGSIPSIQGKSADFIRTSLQQFRDGKRPSTVMGRHSRGYSDEEIDLIARFFAGE